MQNLAKLKFQSFAIKLPTGWNQPQGPAADQYRKAFKSDELAAAPTPMPPNLFLPASVNKYHVDSANRVSQDFNNFIDGICSAICSAWGQWQLAATMTGVMVNAVIAVGGQVVGPPLFPLIMASAPKHTPNLLKYSLAVANTISTGWLSYTATIKIPGLPFYPAFAAFPGPMAPPMPNVPVPVAALTQVPVSMSMMALKGQMIGALGDPMAPHHMQLFESIADAVEKCFQIWQTTTMVTNVMGMGPIPTFAPPVVPAGPVLGGMANMLPGGFT